MNNTTTHLEIEKLRTYFYSKEKQKFVRSVDGVNLSLEKGKTLGIVGESGSGKSVTMLSVMGLVENNPGIVSGKITLNSNGEQISLLDSLDQYVDTTIQDSVITEVDKDVHGWQKHMNGKLKGIRGKEISMIFQNPKAAFNPYSTIGAQITEMVQLHQPELSKAEAKDRALYWLEQVKIDSPAIRYFNYPYGMSGGMCQRAMIAMAMSSESNLLIADEPTTGLDATIQSKILDLMESIKEKLGLSMIIISHDISVIGRLSDRISVMYGGTVMEQGDAKTLLDTRYEPKHPYTAALLSSIPNEQNKLENKRLPSIQGEVPDNLEIHTGCRFYGRCKMRHSGVESLCANQEPELMHVADKHTVRCWLFQKQ